MINEEYEYSYFNEVSCIAILGGTFNPIHNGHIMMARTALSLVDDVENVIFMPNSLPAYKDSNDIVTKEHRINMLKLALCDRENMALSLLELERGGITYTIDTLEQIKCLNNNLKIYFIIGDDSLLSFRKWYKYERILENCTLLVIPRNEGCERLNKYKDRLLSDMGYGDIRILPGQVFEAASSDIRRRIANNDMPKNLLPEGVCAYIKNNGLYGWKQYESRQNDYKIEE